MAAFNLTAQINIQGPANLKTVIADIRRELSSVKTDINISISSKAASNIKGVTTSIQALSMALTEANSNALKLSNTLSSMSSATSKIGASSGQAAQGISKVKTESVAAAKAMGVASSEMQEFGKQSALAVRRFAAFSVVTGIIYGFSRALSSAFGEFVNFDREMVRLQQVTGGSAASVKGLGDEVTRLATTFGVSSSELITVSATLAQAGLSADETRIALEALAKSALAPSFDTMAETAEGAIAAMRQFGIATKDLEAALGSINAVAAAFAVESADIITAIQRTGAVFASASNGVSSGTDALNEFMAVFTSVRATTRESAETIATGLRTIFTRIQRGSTIEALREFGIELTDLEGKFVGPYEAVRRLSEGLAGLDTRDVRFGNIVEQLGGFRQIGKVIPMIQQFAVAQEALAVAQRGAGSLGNDAAKAQSGLAVQFTKTREEFLGLVRALGQSKTFQNIISMGLTLTNTLIGVVGAFKPLLPYLAILAAIKGGKALMEFGSGFLGGLGKKPAGGTGGETKEVSAAAKEKETADTSSRLQVALGENTSALLDVTTALRSLETAVLSSRSGGKGLSGGGRVRAFARGGFVPGSGSGDTVPAMLEPGEFVIRKKAVDTLGASNLHKMNKSNGGNMRVGGYSGGGAVQKFASGGMYKNITTMSTSKDQIKAYDADSLIVRVTLEKNDYDKYNKNEYEDGVAGYNKAFDGYIRDGRSGKQGKETPISYSDYEKRALPFQRSSTRIKGYDAYELGTSLQERLQYPSTGPAAPAAAENKAKGKEGKEFTQKQLGKTRAKTGEYTDIDQAFVNTNKLDVFNRPMVDFTKSANPDLQAFPQDIIKEGLAKPSNPDQDIIQMNTLARRHAIMAAATPRGFGNNNELSWDKEITDDFMFNYLPVGAPNRFDKKNGKLLRRNENATTRDLYDQREIITSQLDENFIRQMTNTGGKAKLANGGMVQKFMAGGIVERKVGYIDTDVLRDPANQAVVGPAMKGLKITDVNAYKTYLSKLAASSRKEGSLSKLRTIAGMPGAGKSSLMLGGSQSAVSDNAKLRRTTRFPILKPEDIRSASEVIDTTATVTPDKLDDYLKAADKIYMLSTSTKEEQKELKRRRGSRDTTGVNLFGRKPGSTSGAETDSGPLEAMLGSDIDASKLRTLGISSDYKLKRKENIEVQKKKIALLHGSLSPSTIGHESLRTAAEAMGVPLEDFLVLISNNEAITSADEHSLRTAVFDQDFRMLAAQAAFKGSMVSKQSNRGFVLPDVMEISPGPSGKRRFIRPEEGSLGMMVAGEGKNIKKYLDKGYKPVQIPRTGAVSGTVARASILSGNLEEMKKILSPDVFSLVSQYLPQLQNRSSILPRIVEHSKKRQAYSLADIEKELAGLPQRIDRKKAASDPEYAAMAAQVEELRNRRDKINSRASFEPFAILHNLARRYPETYGLQPDTTLSQAVKESVRDQGIVSAKSKPKNPGGAENPKFTAGGKPKTALPATAAQIFSMLQGSKIPEDLKYGEFNGVPITDGMVRQTWRADYSDRMSGDKAASYGAVRDYFLQKFNSNKEIKAAQLAKRTAAATQVGLVGLLPFGHSETKGPFDINGTDVVMHERGLSPRFQPMVEKMQERSKANANEFAGDLQREATTGGLVSGENMVYDFDKTLVSGADLFDSNGNLDVPGYNDPKRVAEALQKGRLTPLGIDLKDKLSSYPELLERVRVLTARPPNNGALLSKRLAELGLNIPASKITGMSGRDKSTNVTDLETLVDDNINTIKQMRKVGKSAIEYSPIKSGLSDAQNMATGQANIEGAIIEQAMALFGAPIVEGAKATRAIDYPQGLGAAASYFPGISSSMPAEVKRTIDSDSRSQAIDEFTRYLFPEPVPAAKGMAMGGVAEAADTQEKRHYIGNGKYLTEDQVRWLNRLEKDRDSNIEERNKVSDRFNDRLNEADQKQIRGQTKKQTGGEESISLGLGIGELSGERAGAVSEYLNGMFKITDRGWNRGVEQIAFEHQKRGVELDAQIDPIAEQRDINELKKLKLEAEKINQERDLVMAQGYAATQKARFGESRRAEPTNHLGKNLGGPINKFASGGFVPGSGSGDTVPAMLEPGEFVIRKKAVETLGVNNLHSMNKSGGGMIQKFANGSKVEKLGQEVYGLIEKSGLKNETSSIVQWSNSAGYNLEEFKTYLAKRVEQKNSKAGIKTDPKALAESLKTPSFKTSTPAQLALAAKLKGSSDAAYTPTPSPAENMASVNRAIRGYAVGGETEEKKTKNYGQIALKDAGSRISASYLPGAARQGEVTADQRGSLYTVQSSSATGGYGPKLYDIVMEAASSKGSMLTSDRNRVSPAAFDVWKYYFKNRGDVNKTPLAPMDWYLGGEKSMFDPDKFASEDPTTWPPKTDDSWILQSGYTKSPLDINNPNMVQRLALGGPVDVFHGSNSGTDDSVIENFKKNGVQNDIAQGYGQGAGFYVWSDLTSAKNHATNILKSVGPDAEANPMSTGAETTGSKMVVTLKEILDPNTWDLDYETNKSKIVSWIAANADKLKPLLAEEKGQVSLNNWNDTMVQAQDETGSRKWMKTTGPSDIRQGELIGKLMNRLQAKDPSIVNPFEEEFFSSMGPGTAIKYVGGDKLLPTNIEKFALGGPVAAGGQASGPVFGTGAMNFPASVTEKYTSEQMKIIQRALTDPNTMQNERIVVDDKAVQDQFDQKPLDKSAFVSSFTKQISRDSLFSNMANFAKVIGIPGESLTSILPQLIDFEAPSKAEPNAFFDRDAMGSFGVGATELAKFGWTEQNEQDLYGYKALAKENSDKLMQTISSSSHDPKVAAQLWDAEADLGLKLGQTQDLRIEAAQAARKVKQSNAKETGRGALSFSTSETSPALSNSVLYHELTHQVFNSLRAKVPESFEKYKTMVSGLFEGDNDDVANAVDALPGINYNSADMAYGRQYKVNSLFRSMEPLRDSSDAKEKESFEAMSKVRQKGEDLKQARAFKPFNPEINKALLDSKVDQATISRMEDNGKEEFLTTLVQNIPNLDNNLNLILESTLTDLLGSAGISRQKFAKGGAASDTVPAMLTPGEFVINKKAAQSIGYSKLARMNHADKVQGFARGGVVGGIKGFAGGGAVGGIQYFKAGGDAELIIADAAKKAGVSLEKFRAQIAASIAAEAKKIQEGQVVAKARFTLDTAKARESLDRGGLRGASRDASGQFTDTGMQAKFDNEVSGLADKLRAIDPKLNFDQARAQAKALAEALITTTDSAADVIAGNTAVTATLTTSISAMEAETEARKRVGEKEGIDTQAVSGEAVKKAASKQKVEDIFSGAKITEVLTKKFGNTGAMIGGSIQKLGGPLGVATKGLEGIALATNFATKNTKDPTTAGIAGGIQGAATGSMAGAEIGKMFGPWGALIGAGLGAVVGALKGFADAANAMVLKNNLEALAKTTLVVDKSLEELSKNSSQFNINRTEDALKGNAVSLQAVSKQANLGADSESGGRRVLEFFRAFDPTGLTASLSGMEAETEARKALITGLVHELDAYDKLGKAKIKQVSTQDIEKTADITKQANQKLSVLDTEAKTASPGRKRSIEGEKKAIQDRKTEDLYKRSQTYKELTTTGGKSREAALTQRAMKSAKEQGTEDIFIKEEGTAAGKKKHQQRGKELFAADAATEAAAERAARQLKDLNVEIDLFVGQMDNLSAAIKRAGDDMKVSFDTAINKVGTKTGKSFVPTVDRSNENVFNNVKAYSTEEIKASAAQTGAQAGFGAELTNKLSDSAIASKILTQQLPEIMAKAAADPNVGAQDTEEKIEEGMRAALSGLSNDKNKNSIIQDTMKIIRENKGEGADKSYGELVKNAPAMSAIETQTGAGLKVLQETAKALNDSLEAMTTQAVAAADAFEQSQEARIQAKNVRTQGANDLRRATGKEVSLEQANKPISDTIASLTKTPTLGGGSTMDPIEIGRRLDSADSKMTEAQNAMRSAQAEDVAAGKGPNDPTGKGQKATANFVGLKKESDNLAKALNKLATDGTRASNALNKIQEIEQANKGPQDKMLEMMENAGNPEYAAKVQNEAASLSALLSGQGSSRNFKDAVAGQRTREIGLTAEQQKASRQEFAQKASEVMSRENPGAGLTPEKIMETFRYSDSEKTTDLKAQFTAFIEEEAKASEVAARRSEEAGQILQKSVVDAGNEFYNRIIEASNAAAGNLPGGAPAAPQAPAPTPGRSPAPQAPAPARSPAPQAPTVPQAPAPTPGRSPASQDPTVPVPPGRTPTVPQAPTVPSRRAPVPVQPGRMPAKGFAGELDSMLTELGDDVARAVLPEAVEKRVLGPKQAADVGGAVPESQMSGFADMVVRAGEDFYKYIIGAASRVIVQDAPGGKPSQQAPILPGREPAAQTQNKAAQASIQEFTQQASKVMSREAGLTPEKIMETFNQGGSSKNLTNPAQATLRTSDAMSKAQTVQEADKKPLSELAKESQKRSGRPYKTYADQPPLSELAKESQKRSGRPYKTYADPSGGAEGAGAAEPAQPPQKPALLPPHAMLDSGLEQYQGLLKDNLGTLGQGMSAVIDVERAFVGASSAVLSFALGIKDVKPIVAAGAETTQPGKAPVGQVQKTFEGAVSQRIKDRGLTPDDQTEPEKAPQKPALLAPHAMIDSGLEQYQGVLKDNLGTLGQGMSAVIDVQRGFVALSSAVTEFTFGLKAAKPKASVPEYASKGSHINFQPRGTDTVPAMLTPGEFVVNRAATQKNLPLLKSINGGAKGYDRGGVAYLSIGGQSAAQWLTTDNWGPKDKWDAKKNTAFKEYFAKQELEAATDTQVKDIFDTVSRHLNKKKAGVITQKNFKTIAAKKIDLSKLIKDIENQMSPANIAINRLRRLGVGDKPRTAITATPPSATATPSIQPKKMESAASPTPPPYYDELTYKESVLDGLKKGSAPRIPHMPQRSLFTTPAVYLRQSTPSTKIGTPKTKTTTKVVSNMKDDEGLNRAKYGEEYEQERALALKSVEDAKIKQQNRQLQLLIEEYKLVVDMGEPERRAIVDAELQPYKDSRLKAIQRSRDPDQTPLLQGGATRLALIQKKRQAFITRRTDEIDAIEAKYLESVVALKSPGAPGYPTLEMMGPMSEWDITSIKNNNPEWKNTKSFQDWLEYADKTKERSKEYSLETSEVAIEPTALPSRRVTSQDTRATGGPKGVIEPLKPMWESVDTSTLRAMSAMDAYNDPTGTGTPKPDLLAQAESNLTTATGSLREMMVILGSKQISMPDLSKSLGQEDTLIPEMIGFLGTTIGQYKTAVMGEEPAQAEAEDPKKAPAENPSVAKMLETMIAWQKLDTELKKMTEEETAVSRKKAGITDTGPEASLDQKRRETARQERADSETLEQKIGRRNRDGNSIAPIIKKEQRGGPRTDNSPPTTVKAIMEDVRKEDPQAQVFGVTGIDEQYNSAILFYKRKLGEYNFDSMLSANGQKYIDQGVGKEKEKRIRINTENTDRRRKSYDWPQYVYGGGPIYRSRGGGSSDGVNFAPKGTDTVPAMLTPGEFVVNRASSAKHLPLLHAINNRGSTSYRRSGGGVEYLADGTPGGGSGVLNGIKLDIGDFSSSTKEFTGGISKFGENVAKFSDGAGSIANALGALGNIKDAFSGLGGLTTGLTTAATLLQTNMGSLSSSLSDISKAIGNIPKSIDFKVSGSIPVMITVDVNGGDGLGTKLKPFAEQIFSAIEKGLATSLRGSNITFDRTIVTD